MKQNYRSIIYNYLMDGLKVDIQLFSLKNGFIKMRLFSNQTIIGKFINLIIVLLYDYLKLDILANAFHHIKINYDHKSPYLEALCKSLKLSLLSHPSSYDIKNLPKDQSIIFYANHPLGGMEGFAITAYLQKYFPHLMTIGATHVESIPWLKGKGFIVHAGKTENSKLKNKIVLNEINLHLKNQKSILLFPAGLVSAWTKEQPYFAVDTPWRKGILKFAEQAPNTILVPIFVEGQPSLGYLKARKKSQVFSNFYLFRELAEQIGSQIKIILGKPLYFNHLKNFSTEEQLQYLRAKVYIMGLEYYKKKSLLNKNMGSLLTEDDEKLILKIEGIN